MKKRFCILSVYILLIVQNFNVFSAENIRLETKSNENYDIIKLNKINNVFISNINGINYAVNKCNSFAYDPVIYNEDAESHFKDEMYIDIGSYYYTRELSQDFPYIAATWKYNINPKIKLYDKNFNLIKVAKINETAFPRNIWYADNCYYCSYYQLYKKSSTDSGQYDIASQNDIYYGRTDVKFLITAKSYDFDNWEIIDSEMLPSISSTKGYDNRVIKGKDVFFCDRKVSFDNNVYYDIEDENKFTKKYITKVGEWLVFKADDNTLWMSNDSIYFVDIGIPDELISSSYNVTFAYEYNDTIIFELGSYDSPSGRLVLNKNILFNQLHNIDNCVYIRFNNKILGFNEPPIIENGRTLVPMRFLFEQMGANVDWNAETQTAAASMNNTAITFTIEDTEANVNSRLVRMDVPARLVNGKTMIPLRFLSEELGFTVTWDEKTRTAVIE